MAHRISPPPTWALAALTTLVVLVLGAWSIAACGPWDPWETHYGEVARQILARSDPLDLWWRPGTGPDGNAESTFWSKPALPFWLMALSMKLLGVGTQGPADEMVRPLWPELAIRLPSMLAGLATAAFLGLACARVLSAARPHDPVQPARAGLCVALALVTMPQWAIVSRQALTDMFFVGPVTLAMAAWALAWLRPDRPLRRRPLAGLLPRRLRDKLLRTGPSDHVLSDLPSASSSPAAATSARSRSPDLPPHAIDPSERSPHLSPAPSALPPAHAIDPSERSPHLSPAPSVLPPAHAIDPSERAAAPASRLRRALAGLARLEVPWDRAYLAFLLLFAVAAVAQIAMLDLHVSSDQTVIRVARFVKKTGVPNYDTLVKIHRVLLGYGAVALLVFLRSLRWRRRSQAWMGVLYLAAGISLVGKGMIGPGLVGLLVLLHLLVTGTLSLAALWRCGPLTGLALFALAALPWHHAMWLYRGDGWFNELIIINNLARFGTGEQDQAVGGFAYYLRTLGLAALPWSAALPAALWAAAHRLRPSPAPPDLSSATPASPAPPDLSSATPAPPAPPDLSFAASESPAHHSLSSASPAPHSLSSAPLAPPHDAPRSGPADPMSALSADPEGALRRFALLWFCATLALITSSVTKYYHYLLPVLPPFAVLIGLWLSEPAPRDRRLAWAAAGLGLVFCALVVRDVLVEPAWIAHLTTYLYDHMWRSGAPPTTNLVYCALPFGLGLGLWAARHHRTGLAAMALSALLTLGYTLNDYLPAASENWSQRSAIRHYYAHRGPEDPLASWWFYYRGETFFTKAEVWVQKEAEREPLVETVDELRGKGRTLWLLTTASHLGRAKNALPIDLRRTAEVAYENAHYGMLKIPIP